MKYTPNVFETTVTLKVHVVASNPNHALRRLEELFKDRIGCYDGEVDEDDRVYTRPKVIGVIKEIRVWKNPERVKFEREEGN